MEVQDFRSLAVGDIVEATGDKYGLVFGERYTVRDTRRTTTHVELFLDGKVILLGDDANWFSEKDASALKIVKDE